MHVTRGSSDPQLSRQLQGHEAAAEQPAGALRAARAHHPAGGCDGWLQRTGWSKVLPARRSSPWRAGCRCSGCRPRAQHASWAASLQGRRQAGRQAGRRPSCQADGCGKRMPPPPPRAALAWQWCMGVEATRTCGRGSAGRLAGRHRLPVVHCRRAVAVGAHQHQVPQRVGGIHFKFVVWQGQCRARRDVARLSGCCIQGARRCRIGAGSPSGAVVQHAPAHAGSHSCWPATRHSHIQLSPSGSMNTSKSAGHNKRAAALGHAQHAG